MHANVQQYGFSDGTFILFYLFFKLIYLFRMRCMDQKWE